MRYVCHRRAEAVAVGAQAAADVKRLYSIEAAGADALTRLNLITQASKGRG